MSKEISQKKRKGGNKLDQIDRFREHLIEGKPLKRKSDKRILDRCMEIFSLLSHGYTDHEIIQIAQRAKWAKQTRAYQLIHLTKKIFGNAYVANKEAERAITIQMAKEAYQEARKVEKPGAMVAAAKLIAQLEGTLDQSQNLTIIYQNLTLPQIQISDNPDVIKGDIEEVEFYEED